MLKNTLMILFLIIIVFNAKFLPQTVQAGISLSSNSLVISAKPDQAISGNFSGGNVTITWPTSYGVTLGSITNSVGLWFANHSGSFNSGNSQYVNFSFTSPPVSAINWSANSENELFRVTVVQTGSGTGTFYLSNGVPISGGNSDWYFEVTIGVTPHNYTNTSTPFYADQVDAPLPVELSSFSALVNLNNVSLNWKTATEVNNYGFEVERKANESAGWEKIGFINGSGNSNSNKDYNFTDKNLTGGTKFSYRLKQIDNDGTFTYSNNVEVEVTPKQYTLYQNYPNPFNPSTNIKFDLPQASKVVLNIYNILGEKVAALLNETMEAGFHQVPFNGSGLSSGTYIYRIEAGNFVQTKKMLLMK